MLTIYLITSCIIHSTSSAKCKKYGRVHHLPLGCYVQKKNILNLCLIEHKSDFKPSENS